MDMNACISDGQVFLARATHDNLYRKGLEMWKGPMQHKKCTYISAARNSLQKSGLRQARPWCTCNFVTIL